jgi:uncharacterized protein YjbJ (UPF0337 family)
MWAVGATVASARAGTKRRRARCYQGRRRFTPRHPYHPEQSNRRFAMDWNRVEGNWKQVKGQVKEKWGKLTDDDLTQINGRRDQLEGKIQERYGVAKDQVKKDVDAWYDSQSW